MAYYLGLDAGGTKTECALARDGIILARASGGTIKLMRTSPEQAGRHLDEIFQSITAQAGISLQSIACTCVGLAGISVPRVADWVRQALSSRVSGKILLDGDEVVALDAAFPGGPGVLIVAGTGSNVVARTHAGELIRVGGWGPALADEGSGNWIGQQAVRAIFDSLDRGEPAPMLEAVTQAWGLPDLAHLTDIVNQQPGPDFSKLAPLVVHAAAEGDRTAQTVLLQAGMELARIAGLALRRLQAAEPTNQDLPPIAYTGSVVCHIPQVCEVMCATLRRAFPQIEIQARAVDPIEGALWRARSHVSG
jgi:glucosamine kinase